MADSTAPQGGERQHPCRVCQHPDRAALEMALVNGKSQREVARTGGFTYTDHAGQEQPDHKIVSRHIDRCMGEAYRIAKADDLAATGKAMLDRLGMLDTVVDESLERLRRGTVVTHDGVPLLEPDGQPVRKWAEADIRGTIREARRNLELRSRLAGVTPEGDPDAADNARELLTQAAARLAINELEALLGGSPEQVDGR